MKLWRAEREVVADTEKIRVLVVGDSGVGKTTLVHRICQGQVLRYPRWTVGCSVDAKLHTHSVSGRQFFVEFVDVGGSPRFRDARQIFYTNVDAVMFVHDLTNKKSWGNLRKWVREVTQFANTTRGSANNSSGGNAGGGVGDVESAVEGGEGCEGMDGRRSAGEGGAWSSRALAWLSSWVPGSKHDPQDAGFDAAPSTTLASLPHARQCSLPCVVVGTKADLNTHAFENADAALANDNVLVCAMGDAWDGRVFEPFFERVIDQCFPAQPPQQGISPRRTAFAPNSVGSNESGWGLVGRRGML